jgi:hypothetical protein
VRDPCHLLECHLLQPILVKTLERVVDLRLRQLTDRGEAKVSVEQGGFMTYRSTYDSTFLLSFFVTDWPLGKAVHQAWYQARYTAYQW